MNTVKEINECVQWLKDYYAKGNDTINEEIYTKELLPKVNLDALLFLGMRHVKGPTKTFLEYSRNSLTQENVEKTLRMFGKE